jgi:transcriptional regulator of nitric oxide reductase
MRNVILAVAIALASAPLAISQRGASLDTQLKRVFPSAMAFSAKQKGPPPHFIAYSDSGSKTIAGYVFWTTELELTERGYDGPIKILVGVDLKGVLTGVLVVEHNEPYGNFSVDRPEFARQFLGKSITDPFEVGKDVDAVSRATISIKSASRAIRNGARRIARALITPPGPAK